MSVPDSNDDDDLDIYSNLPNFHYDDSLQKLETKNKLLVKTISELEKKITALTVELSTCKQQKHQLEKNISSLYKSAKLEITRKDKRISELTLNEVAFKTGRRFPVKQQCFGNKSTHSLNKSQFNNHESKFNNSQESNKINREKSPVDHFKHQYSTRSRTRKVEETDRYELTQVKRNKKNDSSKSSDVHKPSNVAISPDGNTVASKKESKVFTPKVTCVNTTQVSLSSQASTSKCEMTDKTITAIRSDKIPSTSSSCKKLLTPENIRPKEELKIEMPVPTTFHKNDTDLNKRKDDLEAVQINESPVEENVQRILPAFTGPRTIFSVRKYKKLFGISPLKDPTSPRNIFTHKNSATDSRNCSSGQQKLFPSKLRDSVSKNLEVSSNNCDSKDSEKSRLIDNLKLQRKVSNNAKSIVENKNEVLTCSTSNETFVSTCHIKKELHKQSLTKNSVNLISKQQTFDKNKISQVKQISKNFDEKNPNNHGNGIQKLESGHRDIESNRNVEVVYMETSLIKTDFDYDVIEQDEISKCNQVPLTASMRDILAVQEEIELPSEDVESEFHEETNNVQQTNTEDCSKQLKGEICETINSSEDKMIQNNSEILKDVDTSKNKQFQIINQNKTICGDVLINSKPLTENVHKDHTTSVEDTCPDSCDSFTLEMTRSPSPPKEPKSTDGNDKPTTESPTKCSKETNTLHVTSSSLSITNIKTKSLNVLPPKDSLVGKLDDINGLSNNGNTLLSNENGIIKETRCSTMKNQQFKDLFGESPSKSSDSATDNAENIVENDNASDKIDLSVCKEQINETNKSDKVIVTENSKIVDCIPVMAEKPNDKNIIITPDTSKSYTNFQEAFQSGKLGIKKYDSSKGSPDGKSKFMLQLSSEFINKPDNTIDKENPISLPVQKSLVVSSPDIKHILCDKTQNDCNINPNEKQSEINLRIDDGGSKINKVSDSQFSSELFSSSVKPKKPFSDIKQTNAKPDSFKISENSFLTSGDDSTLGAIRKFSKRDDLISPIKTPLKDFECNNICTKTDTNLSRVSENSSCMENSTFNTIKRFSRIGNIVTPIKTPCKQSNITVAGVSVSKEKCTDTQSKSNETAITPSVINKDCISISLSSEHCEFKRNRPIKKIIKFKTDIKCNTNNSNENLIDDTKNHKQNVSQEMTPKPVVENEASNDSEIHSRRKRKFVTNELPVINLKRSKVETNKCAIDNQKTCKRSSRNIRSNTPITRRSVSKSKKTLSTEINESKSFKRGNSLSRLRRNKSIDRNVDKKVRCVRKSTVDKNQTNVLPNKYRHDIKRSTTNNGVCERRSPSEYFNQQHKSRLRIDQNYNWRSGIRRSLKLKSPTPVRSYKKRKPVERKTSVELSKKVKIGEKRLTYVKNLRRTHNLTNSEDDHSQSDSLPKNTSGTPVKTGCLPLRRLSESPNVMTKPFTLSSPIADKMCTTKNNVKEFMPWKMVPLTVNVMPYSLAQKFITDKKIPEYEQKSKNDVANQNSSVLDTIKNDNEKPLPLTPKPTTNLNQSSGSRSVIIRKRIRRCGERKLEDSPMQPSNISTAVNDFDKIQDDQIAKCITSDNDKNASRTDEQEPANKKKQLAQKTRCIVKMPLDFKNKLSDSVGNDLEQELSVSSSEESQQSDESWRPKRYFKRRK